MSYTKGPWKVCGGMTPKYTGITSEKGYIVFEMGDYSQHYENGSPVNAPNYLEQRANAQLMASAPELLEALELALSGLKAHQSFAVGKEGYLLGTATEIAVESAEKAIVKAKGE